MTQLSLNYLSRVQLVSLTFDKIFLLLLKLFPCFEALLVTYTVILIPLHFRHDSDQKIFITQFPVGKQQITLLM